MVDPQILGMIIGASAGATKYRGDVEEAKRQRALAATTARYSPWTGMKPNMNVQNPSWMGNIMGGMSLGGSFGQQFKGMGGQQQPTTTTPENLQSMEAVKQNDPNAYGPSTWYYMNNRRPPQ